MRREAWIVAVLGCIALLTPLVGWAVLEWTAEPDPLTPADLATAILMADAERAKRQVLPPNWRWLRCEDGASVWLDSGGAEVRLDGCAP